MDTPPDYDQIQALINAVHFGSYKEVAKLLRDGADVNAQNKSGRCALMEVVEQNLIKTATTLLRAGARIDLVDCNGDTPLHFLAQSFELDYSPDIFDVLIEAGADLEAKNKMGRTPVLHLLSTIVKRAGSADEGQVALYFRMIEQGACLATRDLDNQTTRDYLVACEAHLTSDDFKAMMAAYEQKALLEATPSTFATSPSRRI